MIIILITGWTLCSSSAYQESSKGVITRLPTRDSIIALTFDACETKTPSYFDTTIIAYLLRHQVPSTFFISGKFASRNAEGIRYLSRYPFIEIENHSWDHYLHTERWPSDSVIKDIERTSQLLEKLSGRRPRFFRFPGGNHNRRVFNAVEQAGYRVVHWTFPSGDADSTISADRLSRWVIQNVRPGAILIFHVNRRGYHTGKALPDIIETLRKKGYRFVKLDEIL